MDIEYIRHNENFVPRLYLKGEVLKGKKHTKETPDGTLYMQECTCEDVPLYNYGLNGHDQWWSSRPGVINKNFGTELTDVIIYLLDDKYPTTGRGGYAIPVKWLEDKLPTNLQFGTTDWCDSQIILPKKDITVNHLDSKGKDVTQYHLVDIKFADADRTVTKVLSEEQLTVAKAEDMPINLIESHTSKEYLNHIINSYLTPNEND